MKKVVLLSICMISSLWGMAQTQLEKELREEKAVQTAIAKKAKAEATAIQARIDSLPGWKVAAFGTLGANLSGFKNWYSQGNPNVDSGNIGLTLNAIANLKNQKYFWNNSANVTLQWVKFDDRDDPEDEEGFRDATDVFNIQTLYGYKLSDKFAISALGEYRTTILDNFNDPGYLDVGVGGTYTPLENLIVVFHPLNYNFVFSNGDNVFESSLGAKIVADYTRTIGQINFKTNLSTFQSYEDSNLSNYTWVNSFGYTLWKNIGVGFEFGLRKNHQEALDFARSNNQDATFDNTDNELQSYYVVGLNYKF